MATEPSSSVVNGEATTASEMSPAALLQQKHAHDEAHKLTIEDVIDEEDIQHPPPSMHLGISDPASPPVMSEKSAGKQKAQDPNPSAKAPAPPDPLSEEAFPALGGAKPRAPPLWGARKPAPTKPSTNGISNGVSQSSAASSRTSTPVSGMNTPAPTVQSPAVKSIPGLGSHVERVSFTDSQLLPTAQLKKGYGDIAREISKRYPKASVQPIRGRNGTLHFEGKGDQLQVRQSLKEIAQQVGSKQTVRIPIPASTRSHIIGKQGSTVKAIQARTGARIYFPKLEDNGTIPIDDDATIDVTIEGDAVSAEMARQEIESIVNDKTSTVNLRLKEIPPELFPFIAGAHNANLEDLHQDGKIEVRVPSYDTWSRQPPPQAQDPSKPPTFVPDPTYNIQIAGDRVAAQAARDQIEDIANKLREQIIMQQVSIDRRRHQFIVGEKGSSLHDFLAETGCGIILPPDHDDTEFLTISGPADRIDEGINRAVELASSMQKENVDLCKLHPTAPSGSVAHAHALTRYFESRGEIPRLENQYSAHIVVPTSSEGPLTWDVFSKESKSGIHARSDITNLVLAHPPTRLRHVGVDPFFYRHIDRHVARIMRDEFGVHILLPEEDEDHTVVMIFEDASAAPEGYRLPRRRPSPADVAEFERALTQAEEHLMTLINREQNIVARTIEVPKKYHDKLRRFVAREQQPTSPDDIPLLVNIGERPVPGGRRRSTNDAPAVSSMQNAVQLRGPEARVAELESKIRAFVAEQEQDELERGYTITFDFPQKFSNHLIGTKGSTIRGLREEYDVEIDVRDGKVTIQGPKAKAERAKAHIIAMGKKLEDQVQHVIKIESQYHGDLIGPGGKDVNRLQERHKVRIQFPRSPKTSIFSDDQSVADTASEVGGLKNGRSAQGAEEVIIRGPRQGADKAKEELLSLLQYYKDRSFTATVSVPKGLLPAIIGRDGREIQKTRDEFDVFIDVPKDSSPSGRSDIKIRGTKKQVEEAKKAIGEKVKAFDETITQTVDVHKKYHRALIGPNGSNVRKLVTDAGGPDDKAQFSRIIKFPSTDSEDTKVRVEGSKDIVEKIVTAIKAFVQEKENTVVETMNVAPEKHRRLIGRDGETRRNIESRFNVAVDVPRRDSASSAVKITGLRPNVGQAKEHIVGLLAEVGGETVLIPVKIHHQVADNGRFIRRLRNEARVNVDHGGQPLPPRPEANGPRSRANMASMPLITDDANNDGDNWQVVRNESPIEGDETIPWNLNGSAENVAKAKQMVETALAAAQEPSSTGYLILPDPRKYRFVVGPNGSRINSIRKRTGCQIQVPNDRTKGEAIEITGPEEGVLLAKDLVLEAVRMGQNNGGRA